MVHTPSLELHKPNSFPRISVCQIEICLIISPNAQCVLLCSSSGCRFFRCAPVLSGFSEPVISPRSLEHGCQFDSGSWLGKWPPSPRQTSYTRCLGLATGAQFPVQLPALHGGRSLVYGLGIEVERLEWGQRGEEGREEERRRGYI